MCQDAAPQFICALNRECSAEVGLVAARMGETLVEVLGAERAQAVYSEAEILQRLLWHLDRAPERLAEVFVAVDEQQRITAHTIVRVEREEQQTCGLFATTFVSPPFRRLGLAEQLLAAGEAWMTSAGMGEAATYTDVGNTPLQELYLKRGYHKTVVDEEWLRLSRTL
ncbi:MAG: GNAT superfamily N-acetyltransferase [Pseudohongiellaceae bacterium]|jgi:GNAT superfamily N-acetyltransferase